MPGASKTLHEARTDLSGETLDLHRALTSLQEELEAVDWYRQRADACDDTALRDVLLHNMREEIEHAAMVLEWLRRNDNSFDEHLRTYLFTEVPITEAEEAATDAGGETPTAPKPRAPAPPGLTLGSLKAG
ncbi:ferritin-like domain-containing protein [uncultured Thiohalocapsa sp.]|uniref:ferritin-like domain-containing protein n=1 Tax=uncultured Thiohalocapsa sp. TaxID=768990 RepID=UPI0025D9C3D3|nr:ferritin-like domain-containing protein [uncultured Thiohalocapsa sp.]